MGYWAATQVKEFRHEIFIVPEADVVLLTEGNTLICKFNVFSALTNGGFSQGLFPGVKER